MAEVVNPRFASVYHPDETSPKKSNTEAVDVIAEAILKAVDNRAVKAKNETIQMIKKVRQSIPQGGGGEGGGGGTPSDMSPISNAEINAIMNRLFSSLAMPQDEEEITEEGGEENGG